MKIVKLSDGLGNQMFQYAFGKSIEFLTREKIYFDTSWFQQYHQEFTERKYNLEAFNVNLRIAPQEEISKILDPLLMVPFRQIFWWKERFFPYYKKTHIKENQNKYDELIIKHIKDNKYYSGFWQSPLYFDLIRDNLIQEFVLKSETEQYKAHLENIINKDMSVGIHVRRGDYTKKNSEHILLPKEYFEEAMRLLSCKYNHVHFFFFTDDPKYVKDEFHTNKFPNRSLIENTSEAEDLILLSKCKHQIISNSTFSWWAAYLDENKSKTVFYPKEWFYNKTTNDELLLHGWTAI